MIKFCRKCQEEKRKNCPSGYYFGWKDSVVNCPNCGYPMVNINFPAQDLAIIEQISEDVSFIEAMMNLRNKDIVEYTAKLSQFKSQLGEQKNSSSNQIKCPKCGSTNIQMVQRKWSLLTGFMTNKVDRVCVNCKYKF